jgi:hypothetical protein
VGAGRQKAPAAPETRAGFVPVDSLRKGFSAPWPAVLSLPSCFQLLEDMRFIISSILFGIYLFLL